jgi:hypothetical protein
MVLVVLLTRRAGLQRIWLTQKPGLCKTRAARDRKKGKVLLKQKASLTVVPMGITKAQKRRLQKMHQRELAEKKEEKDWDYWFNRLWSMTKP